MNKDNEVWEKKILNSLDIPIIVWKKKNNQIICVFTMNINDDIIGIEVEEYHNKYNLSYYKTIIDIFDCDEGVSSIIHLQNKNITIKKIDNSTVFEFKFYKHSKDITSHILPLISDRIKNPLDNIVNILNLTDNNKNILSQDEYRNMMKESTSSILDIINDILDIVNFNKNKVILSNESIILKDLLLSCYNVVYEKMTEKNIKLDIKVDKKIPKIISIDKTRLKQVIINILKNCISYMDYGSISIIVSINNGKLSQVMPFEYINHDYKYNILFKIKDSGNGLDSDTSTHLKNIFQNNDIGCLKSYKDCGLSFIISNRIINLMEGNMWFTTEIDIGTVFYFNIICDGIKIN